MQSLRASLKELQKDIVRKLSTPLMKYFMQLYAEARDEVLQGKTDWEGDFADLRWYQEKLRGIPKWNVDQIKTETAKVIGDVGQWPASDVMTTILYVRTMIIASIRPADMKDDVYIPIPSLETYIHTVMRIIAKNLFGNPSIVRKFPDDDEDIVTRNHEKIQNFVENAVIGAIIDLTPTGDIVKKYGLMRNVKQEATESRAMDESEKYGFEHTDGDAADDSYYEDEDEDDLTDSSISSATTEDDQEVPPLSTPERKETINIDKQPRRRHHHKK